MNYSTRRLALLLAVAGLLSLAAQSVAQSAASASTAANPSAATQTPSQIVQPALHRLVTTLDTVRVDKWKTSSAIRERTQANIQSVRTDLDSNLPSLLHVADASGSLPALLPAARNLDALYDVVLRVTETAHVAAPPRQSSDLDATLADLEQARRNLSAQMLSEAQASEGQIQSLRQQLAARAAAPSKPEPAPCPTPPAKKKRVYKKKTVPAAPPANPGL